MSELQQNNQLINDPMNIFEQKQNIQKIDFKKHYHNFQTKKKHFSQFEFKFESRINLSFSAFLKLQNSVSNLFSKLDSQYNKKQQINHFIDECIILNNLNDLNDVLKNGITLNSYQRMLLKKILFDKEEYNNKKLLDLLVQQPIYGELAEHIFFNSTFHIYANDTLKTLSTYLTQEPLPLNLIKNKDLTMNHFQDDFNQYIINTSDKIYKNIKIYDLGYRLNTVTASVHMHNICINPDFSLKLFTQALHRSLYHKEYKYCSAKYSITTPLALSYQYLQPYLNTEDKKFISEKITRRINKNLVHDDIKTGLIDFLNAINEDLSKNNIKISKNFILTQINEVYGKTPEKIVKIIQQPIVQKENLPSEHQAIIEQIETVTQKFQGKETLMNDSDVEKINHILNEILPETVHQYIDIDTSARTTLTNIQGKTADQLMTESLNNILATVQQVKNDLEQAKIDKFSLNTRKLTP